MIWIDRELQSPHVLNSNLTEKDKELVKICVNSAIKERLNPNGRGLYFDGIQTGIVQALRIMDRMDIWEMVSYEYQYHDELV